MGEEIVGRSGGHWGLREDEGGTLTSADILSRVAKAGYVALSCRADRCLAPSPSKPGGVYASFGIRATFGARSLVRSPLNPATHAS
jgi:hypothetical protein